MAGRSPKVRRRRLGFELRQLRENADLTIEQVAARLEVSDSKISRIEPVCGSELRPRSRPRAGSVASRARLALGPSE